MRDPNKQAKIEKKKAGGAGKQCVAEHVCRLIEVPVDAIQRVYYILQMLKLITVE